MRSPLFWLDSSQRVSGKPLLTVRCQVVMLNGPESGAGRNASQSRRLAHRLAVESDNAAITVMKKLPRKRSRTASEAVREDKVARRRPERG